MYKARAPLRCRRADVRDSEAILSLIGDDQAGYRHHWGHFNVEKLIDTSYLAVVAVAENPDPSEPSPIVGFAAFADSPCGAELGDKVDADAWVAWVRGAYGLPDLEVATTVWLSILVTDEAGGYAADVLDAVFRTFFSTLPDVEHVFCLPPRSAGIFSPLDANDAFKSCPIVDARLLESLDASGSFRSSSVLLARRDPFVATIRLRRAAVEDHDDLVPIFNSQSEVLTELYGEFFLAELIEAADDVHRALVAEVNGTAVGLISLSSRVDVAMLNRCFQLGDRNGLVKVPASEVEAQEKRQVAAAAARRDWLSVVISKEQELAAAVDKVFAKAAAGDASGRVSVATVRAAIDAVGVEWGYQGQAGLVDPLKPKSPAAAAPITPATPQPTLSNSVELGLGYAFLSAADVPMVANANISREEVFAHLRAAAETRRGRRRRHLLSGSLPASDKLRNLLVAEYDALTSARAAASEASESKDSAPEAAPGVCVSDLLPAVERNLRDSQSEASDVFEELFAATPRSLWKRECDLDAESASSSKVDDVIEGKLGDDADVTKLYITREGLVQAVAALDAALQRDAVLRVAITGPPCAGKKSVAAHIASTYGIPIISAKNEHEMVTMAASDSAAKGFVLVDVPPQLLRRAHVAAELAKANVCPTVEFALTVDPPDFAARRAESAEAFYKAYNDYVEASAPSKATQGLAPQPFGHVFAVNANLPRLEVFSVVTECLTRRLSVADPAANAAKIAAYLKHRLAPPAVDLERAQLNAFAVTLFCVDDRYESRSQAFLRHAFATFPDREYCVLTLPHASTETTLLSKFSLVPPVQGSTFEHVLYVLHRNALLSPLDLVVRRAKPSDRPELLTLLSTLPDPSGFFKALSDADSMSFIAADACPPTFAAVAVVSGQIVGAVVLSDEDATSGHIAALSEAFDLDTFVAPASLMPNGGKPSADEWGRAAARSSCMLTNFAIHPWFQSAARDLVRHALRLYGWRHTVLYRLSPDKSDCSSIVDEFIQVPPRNILQLRPGELPVSFTKDGVAKKLTAAQNQMMVSGGDGGSDASNTADRLSQPRTIEHALYYMSRKLCSEPKLRVNTRLVVVGASDTGLSFLQSLVTIPYLRFTSVVLVSPGGLPPLSQGSQQFPAAAPWLPTSTAFGPSELARLCLHAHVRVIDSIVTAIDRSAKVVGFPDGSVLPYDVLVLTAGLTEPSAMKLGIPNPESSPLSLQFLTNFTCVDNLDYQTAKILKATPSDRDVLVYGSGLEALTAVAALVDRGVSPSRITFASTALGTVNNLTGMPDMDACSATLSALSATVEVAMGAIGVQVLRGTKLIAVNDATDNSATAVLQAVNNSEDTRDMLCSLIVCGDTRNADARFFKAVNDCGLAYDGRLVIDHEWRTTDESIFAAGTVTKFSRRYKRPARLQQFNSVEMGAAASGAVLSRVDPLRIGTGAASYDDVGPVAPTLVLPRLTCGRLPGGLHYTNISLGSFTPAASDAVVSTSCAGKKCVAVTDVYGRLASFTYVGPVAVESRNLAALVGRVESQLNGYARQTSDGTVSDLIDFFRGDWVGAVYHDRFSALCRDIKQVLNGDESVRSLVDKVATAVKAGVADATVTAKRDELIGIAGAALPPSTRRVIEMQLIEHLRVHGALLPMYFVPGHSFK